MLYIGREWQYGNGKHLPVYLDWAGNPKFVHKDSENDIKRVKMANNVELSSLAVISFQDA